MIRDCIDTSSVACRDRGAFLWGALAVLAFSFSLPATRLAAAELDGTMVGLGRALVAAAVARRRISGCRSGAFGRAWR
jgi:hypothetical protein